MNAKALTLALDVPKTGKVTHFRDEDGNLYEISDLSLHALSATWCLHGIGTRHVCTLDAGHGGDHVPLSGTEHAPPPAMSPDASPDESPDESPTDPPPAAG